MFRWTPQRFSQPATPARRFGTGAAGGILTLAAAGALAAGTSRPPATLDFARDIRPILQRHCLECHGADRTEGGLRLDSRERALAGTRGPALVPGKPEQSRLFQRITLPPGHRGVMPARGEPLAREEIARLREWIRRGAPWPREARPARHWAYVRPVRPPLPPVRLKSWPRNPIDYFVLARLEREGLKPSPEADPHTLIRRVSLDLTGLPPTLEEVEQFVREYTAEASLASSSLPKTGPLPPGTPSPSPDAQRLTPAANRPSPDAYSRLVDRLLASPYFGERWARPWLDLARYADSHGFQRDDLRDLWPYRDWVIRALNADMPFDRFTTEQLAGDLLPDATQEQKIATGFHRSAPTNVEAGSEPEETRVNQVFDRVNTTASVWLGTTLECAQCHDHKYDPFTQKDYYGLFAFFNNTAMEADRANPKVPGSIRFLGPSLALPDPAVEAERTRIQAEIRTLGSEEKERRTRLERALAALRPTTTLVMQELPQPRSTALFRRGDYRQPGDPVHPAAPALLPPLPDGPPNRLTLARWLVSPENPLTARVTVNRWWAELFGQGIVPTLEDFGIRGEPPSHPELLDWLAVWFTESGTSDKQYGNMGVGEFGSGQRYGGVGAREYGSRNLPNAIRPTPNALPRTPTRPYSLTGSPNAKRSTPNAQPAPPGAAWSTKALLRLIVTSATYRQSSRMTPELRARDDKNRLLARGPRFRMDAEMIRDHTLAAAGLLSRNQFGPPVRPYQPEGLWVKIGGARVAYEVSPGEDRHRRGIYVVWKRSAPYPSFVNFDATARLACTVKRSRSNTPLQALTLLNDPVYVEAAMALAARVLRERPQGTVDDRIRHAFMLCTARLPRESEAAVLRNLYRDQLAAHRSDPKAAEALVRPYPRPEGVPAEELGAWYAVAAALLNLDETITKG